jgi:hypothetical protein
VYVGEHGNYSVSIFSTAGEFITSFGKGSVPLKRPFGIQVDKKGTVYICDKDSHCILIFN